MPQARKWQPQAIRRPAEDSGWLSMLRPLKRRRSRRSHTAPGLRTVKTGVFGGAHLQRGAGSRRPGLRPVERGIDDPACVGGRLRGDGRGHFLAPPLLRAVVWGDESDPSLAHHRPGPQNPLCSTHGQIVQRRSRGLSRSLFCQLRCAHV